MPRYFRHLQERDQLIHDSDGVELADLDAARADALESIRDILAEAIKRGNDVPLDDAIVITDEMGQVLMTVPFIEALPPRLRRAV